MKNVFVKQLTVVCKIRSQRNPQCTSGYKNAGIPETFPVGAGDADTATYMVKGVTETAKDKSDGRKMTQAKQISSQYKKNSDGSASLCRKVVQKVTNRSLQCKSKKVVKQSAVKNSDQPALREVGKIKVQTGQIYTEVSQG